jgi:hypothetical protein
LVDKEIESGLRGRAGGFIGAEASDPVESGWVILVVDSGDRDGWVHWILVFSSLDSSLSERSHGPI